ncbi:MAG: (Fe-S)-binding protein [Nitrospirae bacterium]|nr:(Fe-S)-binding protein [Nitrospirota bacterium]
MLSNNFQSLEDLRFVAEKCPRCSLCKFPPLTRVEHGGFAGICPSYEEFKFHAASGSGLLIMAMSILDGRSEPNETVRRFAFGCTACGGCDVACKYNTDIEIQETILQLRAHLFRTIGPLPAHRAVLDAIEKKGHPLTEAGESAGGWMSDLGFRDGQPGAEYLLWLGPHYRFQKETRRVLGRILALLHRGGVSFTALSDEPYTGRAALEIGDRDLFRRCSEHTSAALRASRARAVVCLSAEDYATLRALTPRFAPIEKPVLHIVEIYDELVRRRKLTPRARVRATAVWHDSSYLGRLSEPYAPWTGQRKKVEGQIAVYDPPRPVRSGAEGCYEPPRRVLQTLPGLEMREFHRRKEYAFDSGETGQAAAANPDFALSTARRRVAEAREVGADTIVTECPQSAYWLSRASGATGPAIKITTLTDLLAESVNGGVS